MPSARYGDVPFAEQIGFFRAKLNIPTNSWTDIYSKEHDWAFMVAGANRDAIVSDFREAVETAIVDGGTLEDFRKDFDRIVADHGWDYNGGRGWRSRTIYETNLRSSYGAGRQAQLNEAKETLEYLEYHHSGSENPRHEHLEWDGLTLRADDPWWDQHMPPNGWGCDCYVTGHSAEGLAAMGRRPDRAPETKMVTREIGQRSPDGPRLVEVPEGIDPGFEHAPGRSRLDGVVPAERDGAPAGVPNARPSADDPLPPARSVPDSLLLPSDLSEEDYAQAFLNELGGSLTEPVVVRDVLGDALVVGRDLFVNRKTGELKADKNGRGRYMRVLAGAVMSPDEIWVRLERHGARQEMVVRRRYIARFQAPDDVPVLAVFEHGKTGWSGITVFNARDDYIDSQRIGVRLYRRDE